jgi:ankyrin repeat protein
MNETGSTLLHLCAFRGNHAILKDLLQNSLDPFTTNKKGDTCLHMAIGKRHLEFCSEIIRWCVSKGMTAAQVEVENNAAETPYMTAVLRE